MVNNICFICVMFIINATNLGENFYVPDDLVNDLANETNDVSNQSVKTSDLDKELYEYLLNNGCGNMTWNDINEVSQNLLLLAENGMIGDNTTEITDAVCSINSCGSNFNFDVSQTTQPRDNEQDFFLESFSSITQDDFNLFNGNVNTMNNSIQKGKPIGCYREASKEENKLHGMEKKDFIKEIQELVRECDGVSVDSLDKFKEGMTKKKMGYFYDFNISHFHIRTKDYENLEIIKEMNGRNRKHGVYKIKIDDFLFIKIYDQVNLEIKTNGDKNDFSPLTNNTFVIHDMINHHPEFVWIILSFLEKPGDEKVIEDFFIAIDDYSGSVKNEISHRKRKGGKKTLISNDPRYPLYRSITYTKSLSTYINVANKINLLLAIMRIQKYNKTASIGDKSKLMNEYKNRNLIEKNLEDKKYYYVINWNNLRFYSTFNEPSKLENAKKKRKWSE